MPTIGFFNTSAPETAVEGVRAFREGLKQTGFVEGDSVTVLYRWAENHADRLPALAADLIRRPVAVLTSFGTAPGIAAKAATTTIPVVFAVGQNPVGLGLVASLARPGGNATGYNFLASELVAKRLELLHELVPSAVKLAALVDPTVPSGETTVSELEAAAPALGLQVRIFKVATSSDINAAFATLVRERIDALFVSSGGLFTTRRAQLVNLASRHAIPATYADRKIAEIGGLMSYAADTGDAYRHIGVYAGRILKGAKPADLPVVQSSKFELVINAETARLLGLTVPPLLITIADEVIE
jgi:putative tryptophan/tyrosine transport system substrate-binding protein